MKNYFDLTGKVALVTGASSGLGVQFAKCLAQQGAKVAICARRVEKLNAVKKQIKKLGAECLAIECDVLDNEAIKAMVKQVVKEFGRIDILVNNAGVLELTPSESMSDESWLRIINTNLNACYFVAREVGKVMLKHKYGKIINIGSIHSEVVMSPNTWALTAYATTKGAVKMLTKGLAAEWGYKGITVNAIGPAYFESEMTSDIMKTDFMKEVENNYCPMKRPGKAGELDGALLYFASDASSYTNGQLLLVDGGWTTI